MDTLELGSRLDDYLIVNVLGKGGFGVTYQALDPSLQRHLAIKEYFPEQFAERRDGMIVARDGEENRKMFQWGLERFLSEARVLARFQHPNVVEVTRYFEANGTAYLAMKFEEGKNLDGWLKDRKESLTESEINSLILPILDGLQAIHDQGLIHRDVKPANIMIRNDGTPVLIDFGSARPSSRADNTALTAVISPGYSPPEQYGIDSAEQGPSTDIYAIAGVIYRIISGNGPTDALMRIAGKQMTPAVELGAGRLDPKLLAAVDAGLALDAASRPQSALEFRNLLAGNTTKKTVRIQTAQDNDATYVRPMPGHSPEEGRSPAGVGGWVWGLLATLVVAVAGYVGFGWWRDSRAPAVTAAAQAAPVIGAQEFTIIVTPADATVEFRDLETTYSAGMLLPPGDYSTVVSADGYESQEETLTHGTTPTRYQVSLVPRRYALTLNLNPPDAQVEFANTENADNETVPFIEEYRPGVMLAAGRYQIEIGAPGYVTSREWLDHGPDSIEHSITLAAAAKLGSVTAAAPAPPAKIALKAGAEFQDALRNPAAKGPRMVVIPAGAFEMGDLAGIGETDENPVHKVRIDQPFALSRFEITFADYALFARSTNAVLPLNKSADGNRPVIKISWDRANEYVRWLSARTGERYRLPTEAEWEYAARAGATTRYPWGDAIDCTYVHFKGCRSEWGSEPAPVGSFRKNAFGLFDMQGNVQEMTQDCYRNSYSGVPTDGSAWERTDGFFCDVRVTRGGSANSRATHLRSARRSNVDPRRNPYTDLGFRVARAIEPGKN